MTLLDEFRRLEVGLVVVTAPEFGHSAQDNFMLNIMASFAEFERELIAARIADSRARLKSRHLRFAGGIPFGYNSDRRTKQLVRNQDDSAVVKWMFSEAARGQKPSDIAEAANARDYRTKSTAGSGTWTARQVVATLRNPVYIGMLRDGDGIRVGCHQTVIDDEVFRAVGKALDARRTGKQDGFHYGPIWPLKGKIQCGTWGRPLTPHNTRKGTWVYRYYRCRATAWGRPPCGCQVAAGDIETAVADQLPGHFRHDLDSERIHQHVESVVYDDETGTVTIRLKQ